ncbi:MAG: hypothetical protein HY909_21810 [Deltaproteobacteria bacterium]|nr:hypothetical protein [Deltaproteobacteria bacterium]
MPRPHAPLHLPALLGALVVTASAGAQPAPPTPAPHPPPARATPTSGFFEGRFFVADPGGRFWLAPSGRLHLDTVLFTGGVTGSYQNGAGAYRPPDVASSMFAARARTEVLAGWLDRYTLMLSFEFGTGTSTPSQAYNGASLQNAIFNIQLARWLNLQLGMFNTPFTIENRTSSNTSDMIERSMTVRAFGLPGTKEWGAMLWGEDPRGIVYASVGFFGGDGNRINADGSAMVAGRVFVHPLAVARGPLAGLQLGGSALYSHAGASVNYSMQSMRTLGGYAWFSPSAGSGMTQVTSVPSDEQLGLAAELLVPFWRMNLRAELVYRDYGVREVPGASAQPGVSLRSANVRGTSHYVFLDGWLWGQPRLSGSFGYQNPFRVRFDHLDQSAGPVRRALQVGARWEYTTFEYTAGDGATPSPRAGRYQLHAFGVVANYWIERYLRFSVLYQHYYFPNADPSGSTDAPFNRAGGPHDAEGNRAVSFGELMARAAMAF